LWIATDFGFFSIVQKSWDKDLGTLTVRARVRDDLVAFVARTGASTSIADDPLADYRYRVQVPAADVATVLGFAVAAIDYDNFKAHVVTKQGIERAAIYGQVWGILRRLMRPVARPVTPSVTTTRDPGYDEYARLFPNGPDPRD
jgi:hypothetical protein